MTLGEDSVSSKSADGGGATGEMIGSAEDASIEARNRSLAE
jgi:hypothetical protein